MLKEWLSLSYCTKLTIWVSRRTQLFRFRSLNGRAVEIARTAEMQGKQFHFPLYSTTQSFTVLSERQCGHQERIISSFMKRNQLNYSRLILGGINIMTSDGTNTLRIQLHSERSVFKDSRAYLKYVGENLDWGEVSIWNWLSYVSWSSYFFLFII